MMKSLTSNARQAVGVDGAETVVRDLLERAGIAVGGSARHDIRVHDERFYSRVLGAGTRGIGESYMDGDWDVPALDAFFDRLLRARSNQLLPKPWTLALHALRAKLLNLQSPSRAFQVGEQHYDVGNDLYRAMLDKRLVYTCGYWRSGAQTLDEAQESKLDLVCRKVGLRSGMRVLELGCGWGSFARFAAEEYGAHVTGLTVSKAQVELGRELCEGLPVDLRLQDYREAEGQYDVVLSIGIMEHVGFRNHRTYMEVVDRCLKPGGVGFVHTIAKNESKSFLDPWFDRYIFPNAQIPSIAQIGGAMEGLFSLEDLHNIGPDYDRTLMCWHENFARAWPELRDKYDERFRRMWRYYLLQSAGAFRARHLHLYQIVMTPIGTEQPDCRLS